MKAGLALVRVGRTRWGDAPSLRPVRPARRFL